MAWLKIAGGDPTVPSALSVSQFSDSPHNLCEAACHLSQGGLGSRLRCLNLEQGQTFECLLCQPLDTVITFAWPLETLEHDLGHRFDQLLGRPDDLGWV